MGRFTGVARTRRWVAATTAGLLGVSLLGVAPGAAAASLPGADGPAPDAPPVVVPDAVSLISGQSVQLSPLANDSDPEGGALTLGVDLVVSPDVGGSASAAGNDVVITSVPGFVGTLTVTYTALDPAGQAASGTITATVDAPPNNPPTTGPDSASMYAGAELRLEPLANDSDPDGDALTLTGVRVLTPEAGTAAVEGQTLVIRSAAGFTGSLSGAYTVSDARGAQAEGTLTVAILGPAPNRRPVAVDDSATVQAGKKIKVKVVANDSDPDGDRIRVVKVYKPKPKRGKATKTKTKVVFRASSKTGTVRIRYKNKDSHGATAKARLTVRVTPKPKPKPKPDTTPTRTQVETALAGLGLPVGYANGRYDSATRRAVCAWRTITGRKAHRGLPTAKEARAIVAADGLPRANARMVTGVTISVTCQAAFWVGSDRQYRRVMAACTGKPGYRTRLGTHRIFITHRTWRYSTIYTEARMYKPMQFSGGQAMHGSSTDRLVKTYPASHGCVRMLHRDIDAMQAGGVGNGTLVRVIGSW